MGRTLSQKTTLETLRHDAKRWLKAVRASDPQALTRLRAAWPDAPPAPGLRDIQHALAREYGCESWIALAGAVEDRALAKKSASERSDIVLRHAWDGDVAAARRTLQRFPEIARESLFAAAICGDVDEVERRLTLDPSEACATGGSLKWTALTYVAYGRLDAENALRVARCLLDAGADPNFQFDDGWGSPFKVVTGAIRLGERAKPSHPQAVELVDLLVAAGANPYDRQALYDVSIVGDDLFWYERLWRLSEAHGKLAEWSDPSAGFFDMSMLDYLLGNAVGQNHLERAEWLLARGANPNTPHAYTKQPVHALAQLSGSAEVENLLERSGAEPVALKGIEALQAAALRLDEPAVRTLLDDMPELTRQPEPLLAAAQFGRAQTVALLLRFGFSAHGLDKEGISPLHRAVQSGSLETVDVLIAAGADIDLREQRWKGTPLSWAAALGQPHVARRLAPLSHDVRALAYLGFTSRLDEVLRERPTLADQRLADDKAPTPLFCLPDDDAIATDVARVLLRYGASPKTANASGASAIDAARNRGLDAAADLMEAS